MIARRYRIAHIASQMALAAWFASIAVASARDGLPFVENRGQFRPGVEYVGWFGDCVVQLTSTGIVLQQWETEPARCTVAALRLPGEEWVLQGVRPSPVRFNFFLGRDPERWAVGVEGHRSVEYKNGSGLAFVVAWDGDALTFDASGASSAITLRCENTVLSQEGDALRLGDRKIKVSGLSGAGFSGEQARVGSLPMEADAERGDDALPGLEWSTYLGGSSFEDAYAVAFTADAGLVTAGRTASADFPVTPGAYDVHHDGGDPPGDVYVFRFDGKGQLLFGTFLGGGQNEFPLGIGVDEKGRLLVGGWTGSNDFPTTKGAFDPVGNVGSDAFVAALSADGADLLFSTYIGSSSSDIVEDAHVSRGGRVTLVGATSAADFPMTDDAFDPLGPIAPSTDAFVACLSEDGSSLTYSTYLGGSLSDTGKCVDVDQNGIITVGGLTTSWGDFPVTPGALSTEPASPFTTRGFITRIQPRVGLLYSTYFDGGRVHGVDVDPSGAVVAVGDVLDAITTTPGAFIPNPPGNLETFAAKLDPTGSSLIYGTYVGGGGIEHGARVVVDSAGVATIAGKTKSMAFPTTAGAHKTSKSDFNYDAYIVRLTPDGKQALYSTLLGGPISAEGGDSEMALGLAIDPYGRVAIACSTTGPDFPITPGAFDPTADALRNTAIAVLTMLPQGVERYGESTAGCAGLLAMGIDRMPQADGATLTFTCTNAPPSSKEGLLVVGLRPLAQPLVAGGVSLWVDPDSALGLLPVRSDALGYGHARLLVPADPALVGLSAAAQFLWRDDCAPGNASASNALEFAIQP